MRNNNEDAIMRAIEHVKRDASQRPPAIREGVNRAVSNIVTSVSCYNFGAGFEGYEKAAFACALEVHALLGTRASAELVTATPKVMENIES